MHRVWRLSSRLSPRGPKSNQWKDCNCRPRCLHGVWRLFSKLSCRSTQRKGRSGLRNCRDQLHARKEENLLLFHWTFVWRYEQFRVLYGYESDVLLLAGAAFYSIQSSGKYGQRPFDRHYTDPELCAQRRGKAIAKVGRWKSIY